MRIAGIMILFSVLIAPLTFHYPDPGIGVMRAFQVNMALFADHYYF
jgi:hypothetical protein